MGFLYALLLVVLWWRVGRRYGGRGPSGGAGRPTARATSDARRHVLLLAVIAAVAALVVNAVLNRAVPRARPFSTLPAHVLVAAPHDPSFPSDHAAVTSAIGIVLLLGGAPAVGALGLAGAVLIRVARIVVRVHYPSDILGGMLVGALCGISAVRARDLLRPVLDFALGLARSVYLASP